jgi:mRNA-degrading endonuclease toxin of MazEF toxin-antitoxin module
MEQAQSHEQCDGELGQNCRVNQRGHLFAYLGVTKWTDSAVPFWKRCNLDTVHFTSTRLSVSLNRSRLATVVWVPLTSTLNWAGAPGKRLLGGCSSGLSKDAVANVSQIVTLDCALLTERVGRVPKKHWNSCFRDWTACWGGNRTG